ncbi:MAG: TldD/PmbA family protein [Candidatus Heimdallarchaeota archaeon]|nr:TldD/PmbA family protein [Candidatus Heimdallarchaeota archaeon]
MVSEELLLEKAKYAIKHATKGGAEGATIIGTMEDTFSTRFANSAIHQNFKANTTNLSITIVKGKRNMNVEVNTLDNAEISKTIDYALKVIDFLPEDPDYPGILKEKQEYKKLQLNDPSIKNLTADDVADKIIAGINRGHEVSDKVQTVSGNLNFRDGTTIFLSSEDFEVITPETSMTSTINIMAENEKGESRSNSDFGHRIFKELPIEMEAEAVANRAVNGLNAKVIDAGKYEAILDFQAASTPTGFIGFALSAKMIIDHSSFLIDKMGEKIFSDKLSMVNDPHDPKFLSSTPLDMEGVATQKYTLINNGVVENYAHSRITAAKMGTQTNGCGFTFYGSPFSFPFAIKMKPGQKTKEQMIAEMDKGVLITNFHYTNFVDPTRGVLTGMTKDGLFIVENGEIIGAAKNLRFTDSIPSMYKQAEFSKDMIQTLSFGTAMETPAIKIDEINFSSQTDH